MGVMENLAAEAEGRLFNRPPECFTGFPQEKRWDYWIFSRTGCPVEVTCSVQSVEPLARREPEKEKYAARTPLARTSTLV